MADADMAQEQPARIEPAERDLLILGITTAALILFVGTGGSFMAGIVRSWFGEGPSPDAILANTLLLNIALLIFGWRRYRDLQREVAERRRAEQRARAMAETDPLTGCHNRRSGLPAIDTLAAGSARSGMSLAVLMIDLDNFKQINDIHGHKAGDQVLACTAARIAGLMPSEGVLVRLGGDELVCAIPFDPQAPEGVDHLAEAIVAAVSSPIVHEQAIIEATVSIGIYAAGLEPPAAAAFGQGQAPAPGASPGSERLIHLADIAMYQAKRQGRNRHLWFEPRMEEEMRLRKELETGIRHGIPALEFTPYYEQQIDLETGDLVGFEMLARWHNPRLGMVSPEIFIPIAEELELIAPLSESLIRQALRDAALWDPRLTLAINISPVQLRDPWFAQKLLQLLVEAGFPPSRLEIEITETALHENIAAVRAIVTSLKNQGVRISLDDFGTGYSSIAQLRNLPFDRLKIDRTFIAEMARDENGLELVAAMVSLGRGLSLPVTAEGVENEQVLRLLRRMGHLKGQGFLYGQPENAQATMRRLEAMNLLLPSAPAKAADRQRPERAGQNRPAPARKAG